MQTGNTLHYVGLIVKTQKIVVSAKYVYRCFWHYYLTVFKLIKLIYELLQIFYFFFYYILGLSFMNENVFCNLLITVGAEVILSEIGKNSNQTFCEKILRTALMGEYKLSVDKKQVACGKF